MMICGDLGYVRKEKHDQLNKEIGDLERMLKAMIKSLENKHFNPFSQLIGRKSFF